jgi:hypothetical protein
LSQRSNIIRALQYCQRKQRFGDMVTLCLVIFICFVKLQWLCFVGCNAGFQETYFWKIIETIHEEPQSRREWLEYFSKACEHVKKEQNIKYGKMVIMQSIFIVINSYVKN